MTLRALSIALIPLLFACGEDSDVVDETDETDEPWACGDDLVDTRDEATYRTVLIGEQCWMRDNLDLGTRIDSTGAGQMAHDDGEIEKYCWEDTDAGCDGRGAFFEWTEATQDYAGQPDLPVAGICPEGFHLPSKAEWDTLIDGLGGTSAAPAKLAEGGESGFDAVMTGYRCTMNGGYRPSAMSSETMAYFWTSEQDSGTYAWLWEVGPTSMQTFPFEKSLGLSVRCLQD